MTVGGFGFATPFYLSAAMASSGESDFEWQTGEIVKCLLENEDEAERKSLELDVNMSPDKPTDADDNAAAISEMLRRAADALRDEIAFKIALADLKIQQDREAAFCHSVEALRQSQASQSAGMSSEVQLIKATVGFGLYVVKASPDLKDTVQSAMTAFLNSNLCKWVAEQGGWNKVKI